MGREIAASKGEKNERKPKSMRADRTGAALWV